MLTCHECKLAYVGFSSCPRCNADSKQEVWEEGEVHGGAVEPPLNDEDDDYPGVEPFLHYDPNNPELIDEGIGFYAGATGTGKTFKAIRDLQGLYAIEPRGTIVVDTVGTPSLLHVQRVSSLRETIERAFGQNHFVRWHPTTEGGRDKDADFANLMRAGLEGGNVRIMIDEIGFWIRQKNMVELARVWRNSNVTMLFTGQHMSGDFGQVMMSCNPTVNSFRLTAPAGIEFAEKWLRITPEMNSRLGMGDYYERTF